MNNSNEQSIMQKLRSLPPGRIIEVEDFVDFLQARDLERNLVKQAGQTSEAVFTGIWCNPDDSEYDRLKFGDVVVVPFSFTDQSSTKKRPAAVVSSAAYNQARPDLILMAITSQGRLSQRMGDVSIHDWQAAGLLKASLIKPVMTTIERALVIKILGQLSVADARALTQSIAGIRGPT